VERLEGDNKYHAEQHGLQVSANPVLCILCFSEEYFGLLFLLLHLVSWFETFVPSEKNTFRRILLVCDICCFAYPNLLGTKRLGCCCDLTNAFVRELTCGGVSSRQGPSTEHWPLLEMDPDWIRMTATQLPSSNHRPAGQHE
jgi:hypothetical protein